MGNYKLVISTIKTTEQLKVIRKAEGMTQQQVADRAGCKRQQVERVENNRNQPRIGLVEAIADALGCQLLIVRKK